MSSVASTSLEIPGNEVFHCRVLYPLATNLQISHLFLAYFNVLLLKYYTIPVGSQICCICGQAKVLVIVTLGWCQIPCMFPALFKPKCMVLCYQPRLTYLSIGNARNMTSTWRCCKTMDFCDLFYSKMLDKCEQFKHCNGKKNSPGWHPWNPK